MQANTSDETSQLVLARAAARAFCAQFDFPPAKRRELEGAPLFEPVTIERDGHPVIAYRWLGGGRGDYYVQAEIAQDTCQVVVYGSSGHQEYGPWVYEDAR